MDSVIHKRDPQTVQESHTAPVPQKPLVAIERYRALIQMLQNARFWKRFEYLLANACAINRRICPVYKVEFAILTPTTNHISFLHKNRSRRCTRQTAVTYKPYSRPQESSTRLHGDTTTCLFLHNVTTGGHLTLKERFLLQNAAAWTSQPTYVRGRCFL